jgi:phosphoribosylamine--glycine ligase
LEVGLADGLNKAGIPTASPTQSAARIETSKSFMRDLLSKYRVKGAIKFAIVDTTRDLEVALDDLGMNVVVKPTGLTGGKGVKVVGEHLMTKQDVMAYGDRRRGVHDSGVLRREKDGPDAGCSGPQEGLRRGQGT